MTEENKDIKTPELTEIPEFLQGDRWFEVDVDEDFLNFEEPYTPPRYTLKRNEVPFANVGELHVVSGKAGHGKTGLMSQLMAAILCGKFGKTEYALENERPKPVVLYIDTEQGKDDTIAIKNRVCTLAGIDYTKPCEQFRIVRLRDTEDAQDRWRKILKAVYLVHPTDIFLDGALDIVKDYNDQVECQPIIRKSMKLATHYDASLWMVLHENPMAEKLVGTLGSIVQRKVAEIFTVIKVKQQELRQQDRRPDLPEIYFRVKQVKARGRDVGDWLFEYVPGLGGWGMPVELDDNGEKLIDHDALAVKENIERFKDLKWTTSGVAYNDLDKHLAKQGVISGSKRSEIINSALDCQVITSTGTKGHRKFYFNGNKAVDKDNQVALPFTKPDEDEAPF